MSQIGKFTHILMSFDDDKDLLITTSVKINLKYFTQSFEEDFTRQNVQVNAFYFVLNDVFSAF